MKSKIIIFFIICSTAFSMNKDLKMKMVLDKSNQNRITIDIVPENYDEFLKKELNKYEKIELKSSKNMKEDKKESIKLNKTEKIKKRELLYE